MKDIIKHLETKNKKYPISMTLNVIEELQDKYGKFDEWINLVQPEDGGETNIKALKFGLTAMINEGIDIENENRAEKEPYVTTKQVGRIITEAGLDDVMDLILETEKESTHVEDEIKNE